MQKFIELLNRKITEIGCKASELSAVTGVSCSAISRYRTGDRIPGKQQTEKLAQGLAELGAARGVNVDWRSIAEELNAAAAANEAVCGQLAANLSALISALHVRRVELARFLHIDPSYLSRILNGRRQPSEPERIARDVSRFFDRRYRTEPECLTAARLAGITSDELKQPEGFAEGIYKWLCSAQSRRPDSITSLLKKIDSFDPGQYMTSVSTVKKELPAVPEAGAYYGLKAMREAELGFFAATQRSNSSEPIFMCGDMPMEDMAEDNEFPKKLIELILMNIKKGLRFNVVHTITRSAEEMLLGLESWIPLYMTGQITAHYIPGEHTGIYRHLNYVSGATALCGECIEGNHRKGKYVLEYSTEEVAYASEKARLILQKTLPLIEVYNGVELRKLCELKEKLNAIPGERQSLLPVPPLYTASDELLCAVCAENCASEDTARRVMELAHQSRREAESFLDGNTIIDDIGLLSEADFENASTAPAAAELLPASSLKYSYNTYKQHLLQSAEYANLHANYVFRQSGICPLHSVGITLYGDRCAVISKNSSPKIHFVIQNQRLCAAIKKYLSQNS